MLISAEVRWFWSAQQQPLSDAVHAWFTAPRAGGIVPGGGSKSRRDAYLAPRTGELGIKRRGGKPVCEVKGRIKSLATVQLGAVRAPAELWGKWDADGLSWDDANTIVVDKRRYLRKLDFDASTPKELALDADERPATAPPEAGCNVEYTEIEVAAHGNYRTLGFEAFGPYPKLESILVASVQTFAPSVPALTEALAMSYPAWLARIANAAGDER